MLCEIGVTTAPRIFPPSRIKEGQTTALASVVAITSLSTRSFVNSKIRQRALLHWIDEPLELW